MALASARGSKQVRGLVVPAARGLTSPQHPEARQLPHVSNTAGSPSYVALLASSGKMRGRKGRDSQITMPVSDERPHLAGIPLTFRVPRGYGTMSLMDTEMK